MVFSVALRRAASAAAKLSLTPQTLPRPSLLRTLSQSPTRNLFSTLAKQRRSDPNAELLKTLDSEIKFASEDCKKVGFKFPRGFEVEDEEGTSVITLRKRNQNEEIEVVVSMPNIEEAEADGDDDEEAVDEEEGAQFSIPLTVNISKGEGTSLEFQCTAYPEEIEIDALLVRRDSGSEEGGVPYEGPDFNTLDENLQKALHKYLEKRGISPSTTNFLYEYMVDKDNREYLTWLKNLKQFIKD